MFVELMHIGVEWIGHVWLKTMKYSLFVAHNSLFLADERVCDPLFYI